MEKLYHYTDSNGLLGILKNKSIWLSNIQLLNDTSEFEEGKKILYEKIEKKIKHIKSNPIKPPKGCHFEELNQKAIIGHLEYMKECLAEWSHPTLNARGFQFVFSLSKEKGLLSQWRAYCPDGGYSIEIDGQKLKAYMNNFTDNIKIEDCIYANQDNDHLTKIIDEVIDKILQTYLESLIPCTTEMMSEHGNAILNQQNNLISLASRLKHHAFHEESEVRLISSGYKDEWLEHRVSSGMIIPYLKIPIQLDMINEIMIGPTLTPERVKNSLSNFLFQIGEFNNIKVSLSDTPLI